MSNLHILGFLALFLSGWVYVLIQEVKKLTPKYGDSIDCLSFAKQRNLSPQEFSEVIFRAAMSLGVMSIKKQGGVTKMELTSETDNKLVVLTVEIKDKDE